MRKEIFSVAVLLFLLTLPLLTFPKEANAAPGDFLYQWGSQQHFTDPLGVAVADSGNVFVTDTDKIQVFNSSGARIKKIGTFGSGDGQLSYPTGIAVEGSGKIYVADTGNDRVQLFDSTGKFLGKWGHADWATHPPIDLATDGKGTVYIVESGYYDSQNNYSSGTIKVFDSTGNFLRQFGSLGAGNGQFSNPAAVAVDANGNVFVMDNGNGRILMFSANGTFVKAVATYVYGSALAVDKIGNVYVAFSFPYQYGIWVFDSSGTKIREIVYQEANLDSEHYWEPLSVAVDGKGNVYTVDAYNDGVRVFDTTGAQLNQWWSYGTGLGQLSRPSGLALDSSGNVYETDSDDPQAAIVNDRVQVFAPDGTPIRKWTGSFCETAGITIDVSGNINVLESINPTGSLHCQPSSIAQVFDTSGNLLRKWGNPVAEDGSPFIQRYGIAVDKAGNLLVTDLKASGVRVYDSAGNFLKFFGGTGAADGEFLYPKGIAVDKTGAIFVADSGNSRVQVFDSSYKFLRKWGSQGSGSGLLSSPTGIAVDETGHVLVTDSGNNRVQAFDSSGRFLKSWGSSGDDNGLFNAPRGVCIDKTGEKIYVADTGNNRIQVFQGYGAGGDGTAPTVSAFAIPASSWSLTVPITTFIATDDVAVTGYLVSESATKPAASDAGWSATKPDSYTFTTAGSKTLYGWARDAAGNVSDSLSATVLIAAPLPSPWLTQDIGSIGKTGNAGYANGLFTLSGAGSDIWGSADSFRFAYKTMTGDGQVIARVASLQNTNSYAKAGVMIRQSLTPNSIHAMMDLTPVNGAEFSRRSSTGGSTNVTGSYGLAAPYWVKLVRKGNLFSGYISKDGVNWVIVAGDTISMPATVYVGLVVTSHDPSLLCTTTIDSVTTPAGDVMPPQITGFTIPAASAGLGVPITSLSASDDFGVTGYLVTESATKPYPSDPGWSATAPATYTFGSAGAKTLYAWAKDAAGNVSDSKSATVIITITTTGLPTPWQTQDIGSVGLSGSASYLNGVFTLRGAGSDIWGSSDSFRFVYRPVTGDTEIIAHVATQQNTSNFAKAGVMIRQALSANSAHAMMDLTPGNGTEFSRRTTAGGSTTVTATYWATAPYWVRLVRSGNTFTGYVSPNGTTWSAAGSASITMTGTVYVGLVVSSHDTGVLGTSTMDQVK